MHSLINLVLVFSGGSTPVFNMWEDFQPEKQSQDTPIDTHRHQATQLLSLQESVSQKL